MTCRNLLLRSLTLVLLLCGVYSAMGEIVAAEYYIDSDPGPGSGIPLTITPGDTIDSSILADLIGIERGPHKFFIRFQDETGLWSVGTAAYFFILPAPPSTYEERTLTSAEYFFDSDPGKGNGLSMPVTPANIVELNTLLQSQTLDPGTHRAFIRYQDDTGRWSEPEGRIFKVIQTGESDYELRNIVAAEYFFDSDPGEGSGNPLTVTPSGEINLLETIDPLGLGIGAHRIFIRYQDDTGEWGFPEARLFSIIPALESGYELRLLTAAEYFFDSDPGEGNGNLIPIASLEEASLVINDDLSGLAQGPHSFFIRYQDDLGRWGGVEGRRFFIIPEQPPFPAQPYFTAAEFFVNVDPGVGYGIPLTPEDGVWDEPDEIVIHQIAEIPAGKHWIGIRFQDDLGSWSITLADSFIVEPVLTIRISGSDAVLDWITEGDPTTFHVFRSSDSEGPFTEIAATPDTTYTDSGIINVSEREFYHVTRELNARGESAFRLPKQGRASERQE